MFKLNTKDFTEQQQEAIELLARKEVENLSNEQIAELVGVSRMTLHRWCTDDRFKIAVNNRALQCLADYSPVVLKNAQQFLNSKDEKIKVKGVELVMKSVDAQEKAQEEQKQKEKESFNVDDFLKQLGIPEANDVEGNIRYCKMQIQEYENRIKKYEKMIQGIQ